MKQEVKGMKKDQHMEECSSFETCNAPLCPRDSDLHLRTWFLDEDVCRSLQYRQTPMVRRQAQLKRRMPKEYLGKELKAAFLIETAPIKRVLSPEHLEVLKLFHFRKKEGLQTGKETLATAEGTNGLPGYART
jgi:hypothetical protein